MRIKFYQDGDRDFNVKHATAIFTDGAQTYYCVHTIESLSDVHDIQRDFMLGAEEGRAVMTVLQSRSRKYPVGTEIRLSWDSDLYCGY